MLLSLPLVRRGQGLSHHLRGAHGGRDYVLVAGTAADVAVQGMPDLLLRRVWVVFDELPDGHDHARGAVAALEALLVLEGLLHRVEGAVLRAGQAFDRDDRVAVRLGRQDRAGLHRRAIQGHRAGTALGGVAADVRPGEAKLVAEEVDEQGTGWNGSGAPDAVDSQLDGDLT